MATEDSSTEFPERPRACSKCGEVQEAEEFHRRKNGRRRNDCNTCNRVRCKARYTANKDADNAISLAYRSTRREELAAKQRLYFAEHREVLNAKSRARHAAHRGERAAYKRAYYLKNRDEEVAKRLAYRLTHRAATAALHRAWRLANPDVVRKHHAHRRARVANAPYIEDVLVEVLYARDKGICGICHTSVTLADASRDHIIPVTDGGETSYKNMQLAHKRCNSRRGNRRTIPAQLRLFG